MTEDILMISFAIYVAAFIFLSFADDWELTLGSDRHSNDSPSSSFSIYSCPKITRLQRFKEFHRPITQMFAKKPTCTWTESYNFCMRNRWYGVPQRGWMWRTELAEVRQHIIEKKEVIALWGEPK